MKKFKLIPFIVIILFFSCNEIIKEKQTTPIKTIQEAEINTNPEKDKQRFRLLPFCNSKFKSRRKEM